MVDHFGHMIFESSVNRSNSLRSHVFSFNSVKMSFDHISNITERIGNYWSDYGDPRTSQWLLTANLYPLLVITVIAVFIVKVRKVVCNKNPLLKFYSISRS